MLINNLKSLGYSLSALVCNTWSTCETHDEACPQTFFFSPFMEWTCLFVH